MQGTWHNSVRRLIVSALVISTVTCVWSLDNGLGRTPPLGFNTWNYFGCNINETTIRVAADKLVSLGLADAGYTYLNIDDCWHLRSRDSEGQLQADPAKFPSGMQALSAVIHGKGLKFGIYSDAGLFTCAGFPGSRFHEDDDAALFASWGVDYLKYDNCFAASIDVQQRYLAMRDALNKTGRPIYFSMCEWGVNEPWHWAQAVGNSWRTDADIAPTWDSILRSLDNGAAGLAKYAGPGGWNDPDMLEVGNGQLSPAQQRSHFALWALVKAPLLVGANLDSMSPTSLSILLAREVIAINQDPLGIAGDIIWKEGPAEVWASPLQGNARAVVLFNRHHAGNPIRIKVTWGQLGYKAGQGFKALVRDLYAEEDLGVFEQGFTAEVANYDVVVLKVSLAVQPSTVLVTAASSSAIGSSSSSESNEPSNRVFRMYQQLGVCASRIVKRMLSWHVQQSRQAADVPNQQVLQQQQQQTADVQETAWRPWHDADAAHLQEQFRTAAREGRRARQAAKQARQQRYVVETS